MGQTLFRSETKTIGRHNYKVTVLDAVRGRKALHRFTRIVGPALASGVTGQVETALVKLVEGFSEADLEYFVALFEPQTEVSGGSYGDQAPQLDKVSATHFVDNYFEFVEWLVFCFQTCFASFFVEAAKLMKEQAAKRKADATVSTSPTE